MNQFPHFINLNDINNMNNNDDINELTDKLFNTTINETDKIYAKNLSRELYTKIYNDLANILKQSDKLELEENNDYYCISKFIQFYEDASNNIIIENFNDLIFVETKKFKK